MSISRPASVCIPIPDVASLAAPGVDTNKVLADWAKSLTSTLEDLVRKSMTNSRYAASQTGVLRTTPEGLIIGEEGFEHVASPDIDDLYTSGKIETRDHIYVDTHNTDEASREGLELGGTDMHGMVMSLDTSKPVQVGAGTACLCPDDMLVNTVQFYQDTPGEGQNPNLMVTMKDAEGTVTNATLIDNNV